MMSTLAIAFVFSKVWPVLKQLRATLAQPLIGVLPAWKQGQVGLALRHFALSLVIGLVGCSTLAPPVPRQIVLKQTWEIESGDRVAGLIVTGSLGDISVQMGGARLRAPFDGQVELASQGYRCIYFSAAEVPAYLFRYCGVRRPRLGAIQTGAVMGRGRIVHFATLRRQPDGAWALVEPSDRVLERSLNQPSPTWRF
jgi:hypothetical protein